MLQLVTLESAVNTPTHTDSGKILVLYYAATVIFVVLDVAFHFSIRVAFLADLPMARAAYYGVCFTCLALMLWRPAWTVLISAFESLVTLSALIIGMGMRTLLLTDRQLETGTGFVTMPEIYNFMLAGGIAYLAWVKGLNHLKNMNKR
ncbi:MAG: hypothetical protein KJP16_09615 [Gammaproteobacteria bacterium]|nr:hypothetical protein [Gammaproteobacteria bacterium]NNL51062.1 hypothetical protein [Woeseiaceae bacterium]